MNLKRLTCNLNSEATTNTTAKQQSHSIATTITTTKSIWERLPYNVGMELHSISDAAAAAATTLATENSQITTKCYQQQQYMQKQQRQQQQLQLENFAHNPPQTMTTKDKNFSHSQTLSCSATTLLPKTLLPHCLQQCAVTTNEATSILQHQKQQQQQQQQILIKKFPLANCNDTTTATTATTTTTTTNLIMQLKQLTISSETFASLEETMTAKTTIVKSELRKICCIGVNNKKIGDICDESTICCSNCHNNSVSSKLNALSLRQALQRLVNKLQVKRGNAMISSMMGRLVLLLLILTTVTQSNAGRQDALSNCTFPARWEGSWFLSGYQQSIHIKGSQFSYRGKCAASDGNKYLIVDEKGCHRCLVIYEKHKNVLQYKESECEGDSMYLHQTNPSAMAMRSVLKQSGDHSRGGAHPNLNGHSRLSSSDQYIMRSNDDMNDCPSDFCKGRETLQNLCDQIPGDALLYSLFRESAEPVKCPLKGPFVFTYNRGHGECKSPVSNIDSCTEDSRLLLSFQACPDVQGTESTVEELTCLATWKDGNSRYLVGLVSHHHAISNEERYRCFVYEKISSLMGGSGLTSSKDAEYKLAQSGDATCNGLDSAEVGSRIMSLRKPPPAERCDFPAWFKGPRHWHALMGNAVYNYHSNDGSMHIIKPNGYMETRALCEQINKQTSTEMMAIVHYTTGCQSGFMCMMFYRRDTHVIEIQAGKQASRLEDACAPDHFDINRMPYITLLANNPDPQICPLEGLYNLRGAIGPPHISARHKRNHNNKGHSGHGHHHLQHDLNAGGVGVGGMGIESGSNGIGIGIGGNAFGHKRHNALSFRNSEEIEQSSWHSHTRGLPIRNRRAAAAVASSSSSTSSAMSSLAAATNFDVTKVVVDMNSVDVADVDNDDDDDADDDDDGAGDDVAQTNKDDDGDEPANDDSTVEINLMRKTAGKKYIPTHLNYNENHDNFAVVGNNVGRAALRNSNNHVANARVTTELKAFVAATTSIDGNHLSKLPVSTTSTNYRNNNNSNNNESNNNRNDYGNQQEQNNESNSIIIGNSNQQKNNKKWQQQQKLKQLKMTANGEEKFSMKTKSPTTFAKTNLKLQQQQKQQQRYGMTTGASTTDPKVVRGTINPTADIASAALVAPSVSINNRIAFVPAAAATTQQRSRRDAPNCIVNYKAQRQLWIGCTAPNLIDVRPQCNDDGDEEYSCHGSWSENGTVYIIARHKGSKHGVCISYRPLEGAAAQLVIGDACYRAATLPPEHPLVANLTVFGKCGDTSATRPSLHAEALTNWWMTLTTSSAVIMLTYILSQTHTRALVSTQAHTQIAR